MYYINIFFIYSFLGYLFELLINKIFKTGHGSGILYGPWTPIYGIGAIIILVISQYIFKILHVSIFLEILIVLLLIMLILTILEWLAGVLIEKIFHVTFWDYRKFKFNLGKYISLEASTTWGIGALVIIYILQPLIDKFIYLIPKFITYILLIIFVIDLIVILIKKKIHR